MIRPFGQGESRWTKLIQSVQGCSKKFIQEESGQAITEYILILAFSVSILIALSRAILSAIDNSVLKLGSRLERALKTGRAPASVWKN